MENAKVCNRFAKSSIKSIKGFRVKIKGLIYARIPLILGGISR